MGIPKKKSRPLQVSGESFRWLRKGSSRYVGTAPVTHSITVQHESGGPVFQFTLEAQDTYDPTHGMRDLRAARQGVTPALVARVVEAALREGWCPDDAAGPPYRLRETVDLGPGWTLS